MADIIKLNALHQTLEGVYMPSLPEGGLKKEFAYSDGEATERYLSTVLREADDLSTGSESLGEKIIDWPSEYHLTSQRANLLRPYDFSGVNTVLELGSGCGAISRYMGEQGFQVDAIEGSEIRANLGKLRCRDLDNVRVVSANYNDLQIPEQYYDLILFVGVIEYAHKFHPDAETDRAAALQILQQARRYLKPAGMVFVAIENRLGFKYLLGAHEDHYAKRYVGVNGYIDSAGIATYSHHEWQQMIADSGFSYSAFSFPFPDYKIPKVVLAEQYVAQNPYASNHLENLISRDYYVPVNRSITESICWQGASHGGFLAETANSFSILMGNNAGSIESAQSFDFCHGPGTSRKQHYAVTTIKPKNQPVVLKHSLVDGENPGNKGVEQNLEQQTYLPGNLLSMQWLRTILIYVRRQEFEQCLHQYYEFLQRAENNGTLKIDLLPINIIEDSHGQWQVFDQEWEVDWPLTADFVYFRALLTFIITNWVYLKDYLAWLELQSVRDFVEYGFNTNKRHLAIDLEQYIKWENRFQNSISRVGHEGDVQTLLDTVFDFSAAAEKVYATAYWCGDDKTFGTENSKTIPVKIDPALQTICFDLHGEDSIQRIRLDPFDIRKPDGVGYYQVESIAIVNRKKPDTPLWQIAGQQNIVAACKGEATIFVGDERSGTWIATTDFPKMEFALSEPISCSEDNVLQIQVGIKLTTSMDYALAYNHYLVAAAQAEKYQQRIQPKLDKVTSLESRVKDLERVEDMLTTHLDAANTELAAIKTSKPFLIGTKIINTAQKLRGLAGRKSSK